MSMNTNSIYQTILEEYTRWNKLQKLVFIEVLEDLLRPLENHGSKIMSLEMSFLEEMVNTFKMDLALLPSGKVENIMNEIMLSFPRSEEWEEMVVFWYNKAKIHFWKEIRNELISIGDDEINEIHVYRKIFILNLEKRAIIKRHTIIKNSFLDKWIQDYKKLFFSRDKNWEVNWISEENLDNGTKMELSQIREIFWEKEIDKAALELLKLDLIFISFKKEDIIKSLEIINWKVHPVNKTQFDYHTWILSYKGEQFSFKKWFPPSILLKIIFLEKISISLYDAHRLLNQEYPLNKNDFYRWWKSDVESIIKWINRRIRWKFPKDQLLVISESSILRPK